MFSVGNTFPEHGVLLATLSTSDVRLSCAEVVKEVLDVSKVPFNEALPNRSSTFLRHSREGVSWKFARVHSMKHCRTDYRLVRAEVVKKIHDVIELVVR